MTLVCDCSHRQFGFTTVDGLTWLCAQCYRPTKQWLEAHGDSMLNYFKGGPLDNCVYETSMLLTSPTEPGLKSLSEYNWTPELKTSETTGKVARVWVHGSLFIPGSVSPVPVKPAGSIQRVAPTQNTKKEQRPMSDLKDRRVALGVSRAKVADAAGLTQAKLYRIENEGKKNTDEEVAQVSEALDRLEAERPAATEPEPVPSE